MYLNVFELNFKPLLSPLSNCQSVPSSFPFIFAAFLKRRIIIYRWNDDSENVEADSFLGVSGWVGRRFIWVDIYSQQIHLIHIKPFSKLSPVLKNVFFKKAHPADIKRIEKEEEKSSPARYKRKEKKKLT